MIYMTLNALKMRITYASHYIPYAMPFVGFAIMSYSLIHGVVAEVFI